MGLFIKEQKLIVIQVMVFSMILAVTIVIGAVTYNKTSIYDRQDALEKQQSIKGGFSDLQKNVEEEGLKLK